MFDDPKTLWIVLALANVPLYWLGGRLLFESWREFMDAIKPDFAAWRDQEWNYNDPAVFKLWLLIIICAGLVVLEHWVLTSLQLA